MEDTARRVPANRGELAQHRNSIWMLDLPCSELWWSKFWLLRKTEVYNGWKSGAQRSPLGIFFHVWACVSASLGLYLRPQCYNTLLKALVFFLYSTYSCSGLGSWRYPAFQTILARQPEGLTKSSWRWQGPPQPVANHRPFQTTIACPFSPMPEGCALGITHRTELAGRIIEATKYEFPAGRNEAHEKKTLFLGLLSGKKGTSLGISNR